MNATGPATATADADGRIVLSAEGPRAWDDPAMIERLMVLAAP